ncbi:MAG TPA: nitroreductase family protein [Allocoleopsis sp.]
MLYSSIYSVILSSIINVCKRYGWIILNKLINKRKYSTRKKVLKINNKYSYKKSNQKILSYINDRYSPRNFLNKEIEIEKLDLIFQAARLAPSGFNNQPWRYIVVNKNSPTRKDLENSLMPGNGWASSAPTLIVCFSNKKFQSSANGIPYYIYDSALSVMSLCIEAEHQGLKSHQMGGFFAGKVRKALNIPEDYDILVVIAIGYEDKNLRITQKISEGIKNKIFKPRERKELKEILFYDYFNK